MATRPVGAQTRKAKARHQSAKADQRELKTLAHVIEFILKLEERHMALDARIADAQAALDGKLKDLDAKVDAFIASHGANSEADVQAIVSKVNDESAAVDGIAAKLNPTA